MSDDRAKRDANAHAKMTGHPTLSMAGSWWCSVAECHRARKTEGDPGQ